MHQAKKLTSVLAISVSVTDGNKEVVLKKVPCIYYPICFQED